MTNPADRLHARLDQLGIAYTTHQHPPVLTVEEARAHGGGATTGAAPMYGMAATFPARGAVAELMARYIDRIYEVEED